MVGAVVTAVAGHNRHAPHPSLRRIRPGELQLRNHFLFLGSAIQDLHPTDAGAARQHRLWRPRTAAARVPQAVRDVADPVASRAGRSDWGAEGGLKRLSAGAGRHYASRPAYRHVAGKLDFQL